MTDEEIRALVDEFNRKVSLDPEIRSVMQKIRNQDADFSDTSRMFWRRSELLRNYLQGIVLDLPAGAREQLCTALLNAGYNETNEVMQSVQQALDEPQGIHLNPVLPKRPAERIHTVAHALEDPTVPDDKIVRRAGAPVANVNMSFHDKYIEENARIRAKLGMKPTITRYGSGCCKWCSEVAGRYRFGDQPKDIFRRHDNCGCTIIYDNQMLRGHRNEDGGSSRAWEPMDPERVMEDGFKSVVLSEAKARELEESAFRGLTMPGQGDILRTRMATDTDFTLRGKTYTIKENAVAVKAAEQYAKDVLSTGVVDFKELKNGEVIQPMLEQLAVLKEKHEKHFFQIIVDATMDDYTFAEVAPDLSLHLNANFMNSSEATVDLIKSLSAKKLLPNSHTNAEYMITHEFMHFVSRTILEDPRSKVYKILPKNEDTKFLSKNAASRNSCKNVHEFTADALAMVEYGHDENNVWNKLYQFFFGGAA